MNPDSISEEKSYVGDYRSISLVYKKNISNSPYYFSFFLRKYYNFIFSKCDDNFGHQNSEINVDTLS